MLLKEDALKFRFLCEYKNFGGFEEYKSNYIKTQQTQNQWRKLMFESFKDLILTENNEVEREKVIQLIRNNDFEINNSEAFYNAAQKSKRQAMLSNYTPEDYENMTTFLLRGYDIGYAVKKDGDIVSVFNNSGIPKIGDELIKSAVKNKGSKLDHFDGYLSDFYGNLGFKETERYKWDDQYAPSDWDYEKYGRPDVVMREYENLK